MEKFKLFVTNSKRSNKSKGTTAQDIVEVGAGTEIKFNSGPYYGMTATIIDIRGDHLALNNHLYFITVQFENDLVISDIPLNQFQIEYLKFAVKLIVPELFIPKFDLFKAEYNSIYEINENIMYEVSKDPSNLKYLHSGAFEKLVAKLYSNFGFTVQQIGRWNEADGGVDIIAVQKSTPIGDFKVALQCKHSKNKIQPRIIRELNGILESQKALKGIVVTSNYFTKASIDEAKNYFYKIELKDRDFLIESLQKFYL